MADVDTRAGRQSATCMLVPMMLSGVYPSGAGVTKYERTGVTWMYSDIELDAPGAPADIVLFRRRIEGY